MSKTNDYRQYKQYHNIKIDKVQAARCFPTIKERNKSIPSKKEEALKWAVYSFRDNRYYSAYGDGFNAGFLAGYNWAKREFLKKLMQAKQHEFKKGGQL